MIKRKLQNTVSPFSKQEIPKNSTLRKALECELSGWPLKNHRSLWKWRQTGSRGKERSGREGQRAWAAGGKPVSSKTEPKQTEDRQCGSRGQWEGMRVGGAGRPGTQARPPWRQAGEGLGGRNHLPQNKIFKWSLSAERPLLPINSYIFLKHPKVEFLL